jgi:hydroxypyruvate reductase
MPYSLEKQRHDLLEIFQAGIDAAFPEQAVKKALSFKDGQLLFSVDSPYPRQLRSGCWEKVHIIAFGKAACAMTKAVLEIIPPKQLFMPGIVITTAENIYPIKNHLVISAGHPLPDQAGLQATKLITERLTDSKEGELILALISGGGSALLPAPANGVSLEDKITTTNLLLASGANINQINCVRKHLSLLKGGGMAKLAAPADLHAMILSDVLGDDVSSIASGPTVPDYSCFSDAIDILKSKRIWSQSPISVQNYLLQGLQNLQAETPKHDAIFFKNTSYCLIGSNAISLEAAISTSTRLGYQVVIFNRHLCGEARVAGEQLAAKAKTLQELQPGNPIALIAGGETTVTLSNQAGKGGRNQELALAFALAAEQLQLDENWIFLSGGTDGRDGPTDAAGGIVDIACLKRIRQAGINPLQKLNEHDSYTALQAGQALLLSGPTGTNVADLQILLLYPATNDLG